MIKRNKIAVAIGIVGALTLFQPVGGQTTDTEEASSVKDSAGAVTREYKDIVKENEELKAENEDLKKVHQVLEESYELTDREPAVANLVAEKERVAKELEDLKSKYDHLTKDRDNILVQAKQLLSEKRGVTELEGELKSLRSQNDQLVSDNEAARLADLKWQEQVRALEKTQSELEGERNSFRDALDKAQKGTAIRELKDQIDRLSADSKKTITALQDENNKLTKSSKQMTGEIEKLTTQKRDADVTLAQVNEKLVEQTRLYEEALEKNKGLERHIAKLPEKFSEIARQNQVLLKDTAEMHYNLGVFYTKSKEYGRALAEYQKSVELSPGNAHAHFNLGYIYSEYLVNRPKAIEHFRQYLRLAKSGDEDIDWVKKYLLTWETYEGTTKTR